MTTETERKKVYTVTLWNPETGDAYSVDIDAYNVDDAERKVRGVYAKPGYMIQVARRVAQ